MLAESLRYFFISTAQLLSVFFDVVVVDLKFEPTDVFGGSPLSNNLRNLFKYRKSAEIVLTLFPKLYI